MSREQTIATWMSFTLGTLRRTSGLPLPEFVGFLKKYGIIRFLADNYELLHYYGDEDVLADIKKHIAARDASLMQNAE
jgi:hypothetical protein